MKKAILMVFLFLIGITLILGSVKLLNSQDKWVCENGEWVKTGHPFLPKPMVRCPSSPSVAKMPKDQIQATVNPQAEGFISGSLSYPSETIPDNLQICAVNIADNNTSCTGEHVKITAFENPSGKGYRLKLIPGKYQVYAFLPETPDTKAYYSDFVTCGLKAECPSHSPITVTVKAGEETTGINPHDWYNSPK